MLDCSSYLVNSDRVIYKSGFAFLQSYPELPLIPQNRLDLPLCLSLDRTSKIFSEAKSYNHFISKHPQV